jgi:hypothetical protein
MNEYFSPQNRAAAKPFERFFNPVLYAVPADSGYVIQPHFGFDVPPSLEVNTSVWLIALWLFVLVLGWLRVRRGFFAPTVEDRVGLVTFGYLLFVIVYVHALGTLVELGENYRYRFPAEPLFAVAIAVLATSGARRLIQRGRADMR